MYRPLPILAALLLITACGGGEDEPAADAIPEQESMQEAPGETAEKPAAPLSPAERLAEARTLRQGAAQQAGNGEYAAAIDSLTGALAHQPGHASILANLAVLSALAGDEENARRWLERLDTLGLAYPAAVLSQAFPEAMRAPLTELFATIEANGAPLGSAESVLSLDDADRLIEGVTRLEGRWYVSGIAAPGLYRVEEDGTLTDILPTDSGFASIFEIETDPATGLIWAASAGVAQTPANRRAIPAALIAIEPASGTLIHRATTPDGTGRITDFALAGEKVYFADQDSGAIHVLNTADETVSTLTAPGTFAALQGLAGSGDALFAGDYATGLWRIDLASGAPVSLEAPDAALLGIDGLAADGSGGLIAIRNGALPHGVFHLTLGADGRSITAVTALASGLDAFDDPTLGFAEGDRFYFIANSQWPSFPEDGSAPEAPRAPVQVMATPLP